MLELNSFQKRCKDELTNKLNSIGLNFDDFRIYESNNEWMIEKEVLIEGRVKDLKLWIYDDGAYIKSASQNVPFEAPDYDSGEDLIRAFVEKVMLLLK